MLQVLISISSHRMLYKADKNHLSIIIKNTPYCPYDLIMKTEVVTDIDDCSPQSHS